MPKLLDELLGKLCDSKDHITQKVRIQRAKGLDTPHEDSQMQRIDESIKYIRHLMGLEDAFKLLDAKSRAQLEKIDNLEKKLRSATSCKSPSKPAKKYVTSAAASQTAPL